MQRSSGNAPHSSDYGAMSKGSTLLQHRAKSAQHYSRFLRHGTLSAHAVARRALSLKWNHDRLGALVWRPASEGRSRTFRERARGRSSSTPVVHYLGRDAAPLAALEADQATALHRSRRERQVRLGIRATFSSAGCRRYDPPAVEHGVRFTHRYRSTFRLSWPVCTSWGCCCG
jgi:hypothetical protein